MRSVFRDISHDGETSKFIVADNEEVPVPEKNDVLVQVKACSLSVVNTKVLAEAFKKSARHRYPVGQAVAGVVTHIGSNVSSVKIGQEVVGIASVSSHYSACAEYTLFQEYDVVKKPDMLSFEDAASMIGDSVRAYTALQYLARICAGDTVLVIDGASSFGTICIQLAQLWGAKVLATSSSQREKAYLETFQPPLAHIVEIGHKSNLLVSGVMEETGGLGVDCVIDNGVRMFNSEEDVNLMNERYKYPVPHKIDVVSSLAVGGRWVTAQSDLQLDPPNTQQLFLRGASLCFLFDQIWTLSRSQQGRYQHILQDAMEKIDRGIIKTTIAESVTLDGAVAALQRLEDIRIGKVVVKL